MATPFPHSETGRRVTVDIDRLSLGGDGVARVDKLVLFIPYTCPGDRVEVEITDIRKNFARARVLRVLESSDFRTQPPCPYHFQPGATLWCGGCSWQHITYEGQLEAKRTLVQETLERIAGVHDVEILPTLGMKDPWRYRNKVQQPVGWDGRHLISGFYAPDSHRIMPIEDCRVQPELSVAILNRTRQLLETHRLQAYDERTHHGWIRHLWVRTAQDKALLTLITRSEDFPHEREITQTLVREFPGLVGIHQNVNPGRTNVILGRQWRKLCGTDYLEERLETLRFLVSPASFFQVNTPQTEVLYGVVDQFAGRGDLLLDLYSGVGTIALWLAKNFKDVVAIEDVRPATRDAEANARLNGIHNVRFLTHEAGDFLARFELRQPSDLTVVLDPPRAGCSPETVKGLIRLCPRNLVYVSCDPATLARDVALLVKSGFKVTTVQPVDLFPQTAHIETVVQLKRGV